MLHTQPPDKTIGSMPLLGGWPGAAQRFPRTDVRGCRETSTFVAHGPFGCEHAFVATHDGENVLIAHPLRDFRGQDRPITAAAIHEQFGLRIGKLVFQVALQNAFAEMHGFDSMAAGPFVVLAHIHEHGFGVARESFAGLLDRQFLDARARFINELEEAGCVFHGVTLDAMRHPSNEYGETARPSNNSSSAWLLAGLPFPSNRIGWELLARCRSRGHKYRSCPHETPAKDRPTAREEFLILLEHDSMKLRTLMELGRTFWQWGVSLQNAPVLFRPRTPGDKAKFAFQGGYLGRGLSIVLCLVCPLAGRAALIYGNPRPFDVTYTFELEPDSAKIDRAKDLKVWLPLPREWESQKAVKILSITPTPDATWEDPDFGNRMAFWDFGRGPEKRIYQAQVRFRLEAFAVQADVDPAKVGSYDKTSKEYTLYTRSTPTIHLTPKIKELAREAVGEETNPYLQAKRIERFVQKKIRYKINDYERGRGIDVLLAYPVTDEKTGQQYYEGCCNQISALKVALCRAVGIPARCVTGFVGWRPWVPLLKNPAYSFETNLFSGRWAGAQYFGQSAPHMWTEFLIPNYGWVPDGGMDGEYNCKVVMFVGRDIQIGPNCPQEGNEGYGSHWVPLENGRADLFNPVWNIAKIWTGRYSFMTEPELFPAEEFAQYESLLYPATNSASRIKAWRATTLGDVYQATRDHRHKAAALAAEFKKSDLQYKCGAFVLDMLRNQVGDEEFSRIYRDYVNLRLRSQSPVPEAQFEKVAEKVHGRSLGWFFRQWGMLTNLPELRLDGVASTQHGSDYRIRGLLLQAGKALFRLPVPLLLCTDRGAERKVIWLEARDAAFEFQTTHQPRRLLVDPEFEVLKIQKMAPHLAQLWNAYPTNLLIVYGTLAEAAVNKAAALRLNDDYLGMDAAKVKADTEVTEDDLKTACLCLFGRPKTNKIAQRFKDDFPIHVEEDQFVWQGTTCRQPTQGVVEAIEQPGQPKRLVVLYAGLGAQAMKAIGDAYLYDPNSSYIIFDGDKRLLSDDWEGADPNLRWEFTSEAPPPKR
jgi:transglutaminase-like putative cysteine protease